MAKRLPQFGPGPPPQWRPSGLELFRTERTFSHWDYQQTIRDVGRRRRAAYNFHKGVHFGFDGAMMTVPFIGLSLATAQRGEKLATGISTTVGIFTFPLIQGAVAAGMALIPGIGTMGSALMFGSMIASMYPAGLAEDAVFRGVRAFTQLGQNVRRLETGQGFQDSESALLSRQRATQDLSGAFLPSRRFLGQEARLMHR